HGNPRHSDALRADGGPDPGSRARDRAGRPAATRRSRAHARAGADAPPGAGRPTMSVATPPTPPVHVRIRPTTGWRALHLPDLWPFRELIVLPALPYVKVRYKQTALGVAWAVIQPLFTMLVFSIFFGQLGGMKSDELPYPLFVLTALLPWQ